MDLPQTNNTAELLAIQYAAKFSPANHRIHIKMDSYWSINMLCKDLNHLEDTDYVYSPLGHCQRFPYPDPSRLIPTTPHDPPTVPTHTNPSPTLHSKDPV